MRIAGGSNQKPAVFAAFLSGQLAEPRPRSAALSEDGCARIGRGGQRFTSSACADDVDIPDITAGASLLYPQGLVRTVLLLSVVHKEEPIDIIDMPPFAAADKTHRDDLLSLAVVVFKPPLLQSAIGYQAAPTESVTAWFGPLDHKPSRKSVALDVWMEGAETFVA